ncbi:MAG: sulfate adenylyltransferase [Armatimonadota bacterium]|nr:MAG: sulfate adenylyltransferase [Armatimonadota bacterium]
MIAPHGGRLVDRIVVGKEKEALERRAPDLPRLVLNSREQSDLEMISTGAMSPLEGFMCLDDYTSVLDNMRLAKGLPWAIPITLAVKEGDGGEYAEGSDIALYGEEGGLLGVLHLEEKYEVDKEHEAKMVLQTADDAHPGVQYLATIGGVYLGGRVSVVSRPQHSDFNNFRLDPKETRVLFKVRGWNTIAAFQTRNPIHRAHEYLQKCALEIVDALLIHPLMGETKSDDISAEVRMRCYLTLMENYYPKDRVAISVFPAAMRYAGPREAIFHAAVRKNYGCTHLIVGRDHAGVGKYYGTYDAQYIFREFDPAEIGITPLFFDHAFFCKRCGNMASTKTCPHGQDDHVFLSGTQVREMLARGEMPPPEFTRPEVARVLMEAPHEGAEPAR